VPGATTGTAGEALKAATDALAATGVETPRLDAEVLLAEAGGVDRATLVADPGAALEPSVARLFGEMVRRRLRREPVAYIVGRKGFRRIELEIDGRVLVPRPETELLVELAVELGPRSVLDVGTGSGAIALAVADELPGCRVTATDTSAAALEVARANAARLGLADRVRFDEGTFPGEEGGEGNGRFDLILANLPYVAERDWAGLAPELTRWEPGEALLAGDDGLDAYRRFVPELARRLRAWSREGEAADARSTPVVGMEVGEGQARAVARMLREAGFDAVESREDLARVERVVVGRS
jgi:release factor glutamine methyltransferase